MNIDCKMFGHNWRYNFPSIPNKRICERCCKKQEFNLSTRNWSNGFEKVDFRTDDELIEKWHKYVSRYI